MNGRAKGRAALILMILIGMAHAAAWAQSSGDRTLKFVNQCPFTVWFGISGGAVSPAGGGSIACKSNSDCPTGSTCSTISNPQVCFWNSPAPANNSYMLSAGAGTGSVTIPQLGITGTIWSGTVVGRTGCQNDGSGCATAGCSAGSCPAGQGFNQPATQAEFTLLSNGVDTYDITVINGVNIPVEMAAVAPSGGSFGTPGTGTNAASFWCGNPGGTTPNTPSVKGCSWSFKPPAVQYVWVAQPSTGPVKCSSNSDCTAPQVCGLANGLVSTCGTFLGYWSADEACGVNSSFGAPFNCGTAVPPVHGAYGTLTGLYGCSTNNSCYTAGANAQCCGCENWPGIPATQQCVSKNPFWVANVLPTLQFLKDACSTAYTYPFDDKSVTFTCQTSAATSNGVNSVNYTFTYCPGGKTGAPDT